MFDCGRCIFDSATLIMYKFLHILDVTIEKVIDEFPRRITNRSELGPQQPQEKQRQKTGKLNR